MTNENASGQYKGITKKVRDALDRALEARAAEPESKLYSYRHSLSNRYRNLVREYHIYLGDLPEYLTHPDIPQVSIHGQKCKETTRKKVPLPCQKLKHRYSSLVHTKTGVLLFGPYATYREAIAARTINRFAQLRKDNLTDMEMDIIKYRHRIRHPSEYPEYYALMKEAKECKE